MPETDLNDTSIADEGAADDGEDYGAKAADDDRAEPETERKGDQVPEAD